MNYVFVVPVVLAVGAFRFVFHLPRVLQTDSVCSIYHFYNLASNTTTIEVWEKDKAATLKRHGKIQEVSYLCLSVLQQLISLSDQVSIRRFPGFPADGRSFPDRI